MNPPQKRPREEEEEGKEKEKETEGTTTTQPQPQPQPQPQQKPDDTEKQSEPEAKPDEKQPEPTPAPNSEPAEPAKPEEESTAKKPKVATDDRAFTFFYYRKACNTCNKVDSFFKKHAIKPPKFRDAQKNRIAPDDALRMIREHSKLVATKGRNVIRMEITQDNPSDVEIKDAVVGPSGWLRAPSLIVGDRFIVGFEENMYKEEFGI